MDTFVIVSVSRGTAEDRERAIRAYQWHDAPVRLMGTTSIGGGLYQFRVEPERAQSQADRINSSGFMGARAVTGIPALLDAYADMGGNPV